MNIKPFFRHPNSRPILALKGSAFLSYLFAILLLLRVFLKGVIVKSFILVLSLSLLVSCNMHGRKEDAMARVGESALLRSEYDFALSTVPLERRIDPSVRQKVFANLLEARVQAEAAKREVPHAKAMVDKKLARLADRDLSQVYIALYLVAQLGHTEEQLLAWYRQNRKQLKDTTGDFNNLREAVVRQMTLQEKGDAALEAFYQKNSGAFRDKDGQILSFAQARTQVENMFLEDLRRTFTEDSRTNLRKKYSLEIMPLPKPDLKQWYKEHSQEFLTQPTWRLQWLASDDSASLATAALDSALELVAKSGHCLPDGIGMLPALFSTLQNLKVGQETPVLKAPDSGKWVRFRVVQAHAAQVKSYDRVARQVEQIASQGTGMPLDSNFVLAKIQGKDAIREKDVLRLSDEVPAMQKRNYTREKLLDILLDWDLQVREARAIGLDNGFAYKSLRSLRTNELWAAVYKDSIVNKTLGYPLTQLRKVVSENPQGAIASADSARSIMQAAMWLDIPAQEFQLEFLLHPERYTGKKDWKEAKGDIFRRIVAPSWRGAQNRLRYRLMERYGVQIMDSTAKTFVPLTVADWMRQGAKQYESRNLPEARTTYQMVQDLYSADTSAFRARMMIATIYNEEENYGAARSEYEAIDALWPSHPETYKALFMKGFIEAENLKQDTIAVQTFQKFLQRYPKSDLADDAAWMIKNVQSGGSLIPAIIDSTKQTETK